MLVTISAALACATVGQPQAERGHGARYDGDKVVTVVVRNEKERTRALALSELVWGCGEPGEGSVGPVQLLVSPAGLAGLDKLKLAYVVDIDNVQPSIDAESARLAAAARERFGGERGELPGTFFDDYRTNEQISDYMNALVAARPDLVTRQAIGASTEGREIYVMKVTAPGGGPKPVILMNALIHAREWITGSTGAYIVDRLVRNPDADPRIDALLNDFELDFIPVINPDGYAYTWSDNRLWRKNRRPPPIGSSCYGVDNNRNYGTAWGLNSGSSGDPCNETYRGPSAFSEPENQAVRDFAVGLPTLCAYVDVHSFGRYILTSWGQQQAPPEATAELMDECNNRLMAAISDVNHTRFRGGPTFSNLYPVSGGSHDWFLDNRAVLGWTWELRDESSFVLPPTNILPAAREVFAGVLELADVLRQNTLRVHFTGPGRPVRVSSSVPTQVQFVVGRGVSQPDASGTKLWYRLGRVGAFAQAPLALADGGAASGQLPVVPCGAVVQFYVQGRTASGASFTSPPAGSDGPFEAASSNPETYLTSAMDSPSGWSGGIWEQGEPNGDAAQPDFPEQGTGCWVTRNGPAPGSALGPYDVDGSTPATLTSTNINLAGRTQVTVSYWRWFCANIGAGPNIDTLTVEASPNGSTWFPVETVGPGGPQARRGWFEHSFNLDALFAPTSLTRLRFRTSDTGDDTFVEAAVDNVVVYHERCAAPCPGDWTRDGVVDESDVAELINAWFKDLDQGTLRADFDGNGLVNSTDVSMFINAWFTPCD
jgi:hypothetical protein